MATANLLALDTATENCSVALDYQGERLHIEEYAPRDHTKKVLPFVQQILSQAGIGLSQLDAIVFGRGPGSFTGVRIGVSTAQGLAFGADLPMIGGSTLQAMSQAVARLHGAERCLAAIDARMNEVYLSEYALVDGLMTLQGEEQVIPPEALSASDVAACAVGTGWQTYAELLQQRYPNAMLVENPLYPSAQDMLDYGQWAYAKGKHCPASEAQPVYLRDKVTWKKLPGRE
ncbi:tRNA (adenosine(37)-N6)-threonylcarbamoyltransferase complex dimerization subunit type 1 TsaB [Aliagarivorans taiwanensis]|uniref:tRNA (adenosine(37)-N6)-threonylcarbamoyltransferase complex dimerization subunit type 1 TsaB n=1 Tax=Aliagarivorans taiwanensis TaxID=561966 RepID=UPI00047BE14C|nr:tRNA (adenosine(37)-N6)-threonylcarbamoyltransferase complex dimerization subunit type 1 TsaB [Aliagarivorans taiwanensis]